MKNVHRNGCLVIALLTVFGAGAAEAKWRFPPTFRVDSRGAASIDDADHGVTLTVNAIKSTLAWNGAGCGAVVNAQAGSISGFRVGDGIPMINFTDPTGACAGGDCIAATFITSYYDSYLYRIWIYDADIVTNSAEFLFTSQGEDLGGCYGGEYYIEGVMVHEVGHGLGLGHSTDPKATMYTYGYTCDTGQASINATDRGSLRATQPPPVVDEQCNASCEEDANNCIGFYGGQDPALVQRCDIQLEDCRDWCMCN